MKEELDKLKKEVEELKSWKKSLEMSSSIPLNIDQAYRERFKDIKKYILYAGSFTTLGGDNSESITGLTGVLTTDIAIVTLQVAGSTPRTITTAVCSADRIDIVFSGNPSTDHIVNYVAIRP